MIENRKWKLGDDLSVEDNLLDEITFKELITTIHCNCKCITPENIQWLFSLPESKTQPAWV